MPKNYLATKFTNKMIVFHLDDEDCVDPITRLNHAAQLTFEGIARNGRMRCSINRNPIYLGNGQATPWTGKQKYNALLNYNSLNNILASELKEMYKDAVDEDPSI